MNEVRAFRIVYRFRDSQTKRWSYMQNWFWSADPVDFIRTKLCSETEVLFYAEAPNRCFGFGQWHGTPFDGKISATEAKDEHARHRYKRDEAAKEMAKELYRQVRSEL